MAHESVCRESEGIVRNDRILKLKEVQEIIPWSRSTFYRKEAEGIFPQRRNFGGGRSAGWLESEIQSWIAKTMKPKGKK